MAIIPARAGSVRLPGKNVIEFNGKALIEWTIIAAKDAKLFSRIVVSTDDDIVRAICVDYHVTVVPQPKFPQNDLASRNVVRHVLDRFHTMPEYCILLQPTSPLRTAKHISAAWKELHKARHRSYNSLVSVNPANEVNGAIYIFSSDRILLGDPLYDDRSLRFEMDEKSSVDIDTIDDLYRANSFITESVCSPK